MAKAKKPVRATARKQTETPEVTVYAHDVVRVKIFKNDFYPEDTEVELHRLAAEKMERLNKGKIVGEVEPVDEAEDDE